MVWRVRKRLAEWLRESVGWVTEWLMVWSRRVLARLAGWTEMGNPQKSLGWGEGIGGNGRAKAETRERSGRIPASRIRRRMAMWDTCPARAVRVSYNLGLELGFKFLRRSRQGLAVEVPLDGAGDLSGAGALHFDRVTPSMCARWSESAICDSIWRRGHWVGLSDWRGRSYRGTS